MKPRFSSLSRSCAWADASDASAPSSSALRWSSVALAAAEVLTSRCGAVLLEPGQLEPGLRLPDLRLGPVDRRLVGPGVDDEQDLVLLDDLAVLEADLLDIARDPGADLDPLHRLEAAGELVPLGELAGQRLGDRDRGGGAAPPGPGRQLRRRRRRRQQAPAAPRHRPGHAATPPPSHPHEPASKPRRTCPLPATATPAADYT